jgi:cation diffusion facilitator family transporter
VRHSLHTKRAMGILWLVLSANLTSAAVKFALSLMAGSAMLRADAYYTALDASVDLMLLVLLRVASQPPDENHPYGHAKFESIGAAGIAVLIFAALEDLGRRVWQVWHERHVPHAELWQIGILAALTLASLALAIWQIRRARELASTGLGADGWYTLTGCGVSLVSIGVLLGGRAGLSWPDAAGASLAFVLTLAAGLAVGRRALAALTDEVRLNPERVYAAAYAIKGVKAASAIRSRGQENSVHVDLTIEVEPSLSVVDGHQLATSTEDAIHREFPEVAEVTVHVEPYGQGHSHSRATVSPPRTSHPADSGKP